jgi:hypothetical protein
MSQGVVRGVVVDANGSPVPGAQVEAFPVRSTGVVAKVGWAKTDERAEFRLVLPLGRFQIRAKEESSGYPDPNYLLSADPAATFPEVVVSENDISGLEVRLGPKGGILEGETRDGSSQSPVSGAKVTITDAQRPEAFVEVFSDKSGHFQYTVPARTLIVSATAKGYRATRFDRGKELLLRDGKHLAIRLELEHQ